MKTTVSHFPTSPQRQAGFSMIELLVGLGISLIGMLVIYHVLTVTQGYRRTSTEVGAAQETGAVSLYYIERDLRRSGYGLQGLLWQEPDQGAMLSAAAMLLPRAYGCTVQARDSKRSSFNFRMAPALIQDGGVDANGSARPDQLTILFGSARAHAFPPTLSANVAAGNNPLRISNAMGLDNRDLIIVADLTTNTPSCELTQVGDIRPPGDAACPNITSRNQPWCVNTVAPDTANHPFARPLAKPYTGQEELTASPRTTPVLLNLGQSPANPTYSIVNPSSASGAVRSVLVMRDGLFPDRDATIAEGIVSLQAQYAFRDGSFRNTLPAATAWANVVGIRIAVVARSELLEKEAILAADPSTKRAKMVIFPGSATSDEVALSLSDQENHYRYKIYQTVVPLRSIIWNS
ncbi:PilW family protein [Chitinimonas lacunae]|uniref:PilW family protein n=1 Tax=Chitinimonas lacunae TaxID=1963018 RepID=A0ABV8MR40_9NEIS